MTQSNRHLSDSGHRVFATTHWSVVVTAARGDAAQAVEAWQRLATSYWMPLYSFVRRSGRTVEDAKDLTQGFFETFLSREGLRRVTPGETRFRSYLLKCLQNFLADQHRRSRAARRLPEAGRLSLNATGAEECYQAELVEPATPESIYEHHCAVLLLDKAIARLEENYARRGQRVLFDRLVAHLTRNSIYVPHAVLAAELGTSEQVVRNHMCELRKQLQMAFHQEVAATVSADEVEDEKRRIAKLLLP